MVSPFTPVPDTDQNSDRVFSISGFLVKSLINKNCPNSKTSNNIDMKLGPVTKLGEKNTTTSKKFDDDVVLANDDVIVTFSNLWPIWSNQEAKF